MARNVITSGDPKIDINDGRSKVTRRKKNEVGPLEDRYASQFSSA